MVDVSASASVCDVFFLLMFFMFVHTLEVIFSVCAPFFYYAEVKGALQKSCAFFSAHSKHQV